jgi:hypothetical protein
MQLGRGKEMIAEFSYGSSSESCQTVVSGFRVRCFNREMVFHCFTVHFNSLCVMVQIMNLFVIKH